LSAGRNDCTVRPAAIGKFHMSAIIAVWEHVITPVAGLLHTAHLAFRGLNPALRGALIPIITLFKYGLPILFLEWLSGAKLKQYRTAGFRQDLVYWILYSGNFIPSFIAIYVTGSLAAHVKIFNLSLLQHIPQQHFLLRVAIYYLIGDFLVYWMHRWQHSSKFLWAFHTTHHSQKNLSFITLNRLHPVEEIIHAVVMYVPLALMGATTSEWVPMVLFYRVVVYLQHSQVQWKFGPLAKIVVTPHFHAVHHSTDPAHYDSNFGGTLSLWDYCFGTAIDEPERPTVYGLDDVEMATIASTFVTPFRLAYEACFPRAEQVASAGDD
jgi:sterol desaturase/sphingolipid hydroxylase (fatty acid hydroxylase superfamily)